MKTMRYGILITFFLLIFSFSNINAANSEDHSLIVLQQSMDSLMKFVENHDYEKAKETIEQLSLQLTVIPYKGLTTVEGMEAITSTTIEVKKNLASLSPDSERVLYSTTQLQLAIDALTHKEQPLWQRYYSTLKTDLNEIEKILSNNQTEKLEPAIEKYLNHYYIIRPAIQVSKPSYVVEKIDSLHTALLSQKVDQNKEIILLQIKEAISELFYGNEKDVIGKVVEERTIWNTTLGMGFLIFIALSYVIWKKFKGSNIRIVN